MSFNQANWAQKQSLQQTVCWGNSSGRSGARCMCHHQTRNRLSSPWAAGFTTRVASRLTSYHGVKGAAGNTHVRVVQAPLLAPGGQEVQGEVHGRK